MNKKIAGLITVVFGILYSNIAIAGDIVVGPRFSYYYDNSNSRTSNLDDGSDIDRSVLDEAEASLQQLFGPDVSVNQTNDSAGSIADQVAFPMLGASLSYVGDKSQLTITAMYGEGSGNITATQIGTQTLSINGFTAQDLLTNVGTGNAQVDKYDVEITYQKRLNERFALFGGVRYERLETMGSIETTTKVSSNAGNLITLLSGGSSIDLDISEGTQNVSIKGTTETFSARVGVTAFAPFSENGVAFFNGMVHASHQPEDKVQQTLTGIQGNVSTFETTGSSETSFGPDIAVGAQWQLSDSLSFDMRYRAIVFFPISGDRSFSDARVNHGVNLGFAFRF